MEVHASPIAKILRRSVQTLSTGTIYNHDLVNVVEIGFVDFMADLSSVTWIGTVGPRDTAEVPLNGDYDVIVRCSGTSSTQQVSAIEVTYR